jgi:hypothetical protein
VVFVDAENISKTLFKQFYAKHKDETYKVYAKKSVISGIYLRLKNVEFIDCVHGKNSADTYMTADIVKSLYEDNIFNYYIITQDRDLAIAIKTITDHLKQVTLVTSLGRRLSNLKAVGANLNYVDVEEIDTGDSNTFITRITKTKSTSNIYDSYKKRVWVKKKDGNILEVPFENGMHLGTFKRFLDPHKKSCGIGPSTSWKNFIENQYLKLVDSQIYFLTEDELYEKD